MKTKYLSPINLLLLLLLLTHIATLLRNACNNNGYFLNLWLKFYFLRTSFYGYQKRFANENEKVLCTKKLLENLTKIERYWKLKQILSYLEISYKQRKFFYFIFKAGLTNWNLLNVVLPKFLTWLSIRRYIPV